MAVILKPEHIRELGLSNEGQLRGRGVVIVLLVME